MNQLELYKTNPKEVYPPSFFSGMRRIRNWQVPIAKKICDTYDIKSVVDFGCGNGYYLKGFQNAGAKIRGFEYMLDNALPFIPDTVKPYVTQGDLMKDIACPKADLSMSIEVAEHLLPEKSDVFVDNLIHASNKYILLTAAPPGQEAGVHFNLQPKEYWVEKFEEKGFNHSEDDVQTIRSLFTKDIPRINTKYPKIIKRNLMFFRKEGI